MTIPRARSAWYSPTHGATETVALAGLPLLFFFAAMCHLHVVEGHLGHFHRVDRNLSLRWVKRNTRVPPPCRDDGVVVPRAEVHEARSIVFLAREGVAVPRANGRAHQGQKLIRMPEFPTHCFAGGPSCTGIEMKPLRSCRNRIGVNASASAMWLHASMSQH